MGSKSNYRMSTDKKRILITGATGYIGSKLAPALTDQYDVIAIVRSLSESLDPSIKQFPCALQFDQINKAFEQTKPHAVIHLATCYKATHTPNDINDIIDSNIKFGSLIAEAAVKNDCLNFLNIGTTWQNYFGNEYAPVNLYAASKESFFNILKFYSDIHKLSVLNLKLSDSYGPNDKRKKIVNILIEAAYNKQNIDLTGGEQYVNLVFISDIIKGIKDSVESLLNKDLEGFNSYYLTSQSPTKVKEIGKIIEEITGQPLSANWGKIPYRKLEFFNPVSFNPVLPGWSQTISLKQGLLELWESMSK